MVHSTYHDLIQAKEGFLHPLDHEELHLGVVGKDDADQIFDQLTHVLSQEMGGQWARHTAGDDKGGGEREGSREADLFSKEPKLVPVVLLPHC